MPSNLPFSDTVVVRYSDTDAQGHLYFANYLVYADEVTSVYMEELGLDLDPAKGVCYVFTVNLNCDYTGECRYLDTVRVFTGYQRLGRTSAEVRFELVNDETGEALAHGSFTQVYVDKGTRKSCPIPEDFRAAILERQPELADKD